MDSRLSPEQIAELYATVTADDVLQELTKLIQRLVGVDSVALWISDRGITTKMCLTDDIVASTEAYLNYYQRLDPWIGVRAQYLNRAYVGDHLVSRDTLLASEFYNDFARHFGMVSPAGILVDIAPQLYASLGVNRTGGGTMREADTPLIQEIGFHVRQVLRLHRQIAARDKEAGWHADAFDILDFGVVVANADATLVYANREARLLAADGAGLALSGCGSAITATSNPETGALKGLISSATQGRGGALRLAGRAGQRVSVLATPLCGANRTELTRKALLCLQRDTATSGLNPDMLAQLFGLSPAQTMLCLQLAAGQTFDEAASSRNVAVTTARTHFRAILARTGTDNLRDLLRLLASLPPLRIT